MADPQDDLDQYERKAISVAQNGAPPPGAPPPPDELSQYERPSQYVPPAGQRFAEGFASHIHNPSELITSPPLGVGAQPSPNPEAKTYSEAGITPNIKPAAALIDTVRKFGGVGPEEREQAKQALPHPIQTAMTGNLAGAAGEALPWLINTALFLRGGGPEGGVAKAGRAVEENAPAIGKTAGIGAGIGMAAKTKNPLWLGTMIPQVTKNFERGANLIGRGTETVGEHMATPESVMPGRPTPFSTPEVPTEPKGLLPPAPRMMPPPEPVAEPTTKPAASQIVRGPGGRMTKQFLTGTAEPGAKPQYGAQPPVERGLGEPEAPPQVPEQFRKESTTAHPLIQTPTVEDVVHPQALEEVDRALAQNPEKAPPTVESLTSGDQSRNIINMPEKPTRRDFLKTAGKATAGAAASGGLEGAVKPLIEGAIPGASEGLAALSTAKGVADFAQSFWNRMGFGGDDDVDYNGGYLSGAAEAMEKYAKEKGVTGNVTVPADELSKYMGEEWGDPEEGSGYDFSGLWSEGADRTHDLLKTAGIFMDDAGNMHFNPQRLQLAHDIANLTWSAMDGVSEGTPSEVETAKDAASRVLPRLEMMEKTGWSSESTLERLYKQDEQRVQELNKSYQQNPTPETESELREAIQKRDYWHNEMPDVDKARVSSPTQVNLPERATSPQKPEEQPLIKYPQEDVLEDQEMKQKMQKDLEKSRGRIQGEYPVGSDPERINTPWAMGEEGINRPGIGPGGKLIKFPENRTEFENVPEEEGGGYEAFNPEGLSEADTNRVKEKSKPLITYQMPEPEEPPRSGQENSLPWISPKSGALIGTEDLDHQDLFDAAKIRGSGRTYDETPKGRLVFDNKNKEIKVHSNSESVVPADLENTLKSKYPGYKISFAGSMEKKPLITYQMPDPEEQPGNRIKFADERPISGGELIGPQGEIPKKSGELTKENIEQIKKEGGPDFSPETALTKSQGTTRRDFLKKAGIAGAGMAAGPLIGGLNPFEETGPRVPNLEPVKEVAKVTPYVAPNTKDGLLDLYTKWLNRDPEYGGYSKEDFTTGPDNKGYGSFDKEDAHDEGPYHVATFSADMGDEGGPATVTGYFNKSTGELEFATQTFDGMPGFIHRKGEVEGLGNVKESEPYRLQVPETKGKEEFGKMKSANRVPKALKDLSKLTDIEVNKPWRKVSEHKDGNNGYIVRTYQLGRDEYMTGYYDAESNILQHAFGIKNGKPQFFSGDKYVDESGKGQKDPYGEVKPEEGESKKFRDALENEPEVKRLYDESRDLANKALEAARDPKTKEVDWGNHDKLYNSPERQAADKAFKKYWDAREAAIPKIREKLGLHETD